MKGRERWKEEGLDKGRIGKRMDWAKNGLERTGRKKDGLDKGRFGQRKVWAKARFGQRKGRIL